MTRRSARGGRHNGSGEGGAHEGARRTGLAVLAAAALALAACSPIVRNHGYVPSDTDLAEISVGLDTRETVEDTIGSPGASGVLGDRGYYYVSQRIEQRGPRAPEVIDRQVVAISFDERGIVSNIERFGLEEGNVVALSRRVTDSNVQGVGFLRQLMGNLGRVNPEALGAAP